MGMTLSADVGVGIVLPDPDAEDRPAGLSAIMERYLDEDEDYGEMYYQFLKEFPLLILSYGGLLEGYQDYSVMVKSTRKTVWSGSDTINPSSFSISNEEFDQLARLISALGYEKVNPEIVVSVSYG